jgi:hypothetical protein
VCVCVCGLILHTCLCFQGKENCLGQFYETNSVMSNQNRYLEDFLESFIHMVVHGPFQRQFQKQLSHFQA